MTGKIEDLRLQKMMEARDRQNNVSVILQLKGSAPKIRIKKKLSRGNIAFEKSISAPPPSNFIDDVKQLKQHLANVGVNEFVTLSSAKSIVIPNATIDQVEKISRFPEVSRISLNKTHFK